jgi:hypothetical protein
MITQPKEDTERILVLSGNTIQVALSQPTGPLAAVVWRVIVEGHEGSSRLSSGGVISD